MKLKQRLCILVTLLILFSNTAFAIDLSLIQFENLPDLELLKPDLEYIYNHEGHLSTFIPDEHWNIDTTKLELTEKLIEIVITLEQYENTDENQDLTLLKGLIYSYLFNLDVQRYYNKAIEELEKIENYAYSDYRYIWFLGTIYAKSIKPYDAIVQFEYIEAQVPEDQLHPLFWADYGEALSYAFMQEKSLEAFEKYAKYGNVNLDNNWFYQDMKEAQVITSVDMEIPKENMYQLYERESGQGYLCRPFDIWIPARGDWIPRIFEYSKNFSGIAFKSADIVDDFNNSITYTIGAFLFTGREDVLNQYMSMAPIVEVIEDPDFNSRFTVLEIHNPEQYKHIGGAHGYFVIYEPEIGESTGDSIEEPSKIRLKPGPETQYMAFNPIYSRFPGKLSYVFLLDSCENIFEESKADFIEFMKKVIIE